MHMELTLYRFKMKSSLNESHTCTDVIPVLQSYQYICHTYMDVIPILKSFLF